DAQTLYNRQFRDDDSHLALLLARGLGRGDGGRWRARLGAVTDSPAELVRRQLWWALVHDMPARVRLLVRSGVDFHRRFSADDGRPHWARATDGLTPAEVAEINGNLAIVGYLVSEGAAPPALEGA